MYRCIDYIGSTLFTYIIEIWDSNKIKIMFQEKWSTIKKEDTCLVSSTLAYYAYKRV